MLMTIGKIIICALSVLIIVLILLQKPKEGIGGSFGGDTYFSKTKGKTYEARLDRYTKIAAVALAVGSFALVLIQKLAA